MRRLEHRHCKSSIMCSRRLKVVCRQIKITCLTSTFKWCKKMSLMGLLMPGIRSSGRNEKANVHGSLTGVSVRHKPAIQSNYSWNDVKNKAVSKRQSKCFRHFCRKNLCKIRPFKSESKAISQSRHKRCEWSSKKLNSQKSKFSPTILNLLRKER